ncbi:MULTISPECIES: glycosyltransferase family 4 protein [Empedobacter]|uniref:glycosyltransferase family 4 protein n=1 Tax=Empedobacter TaxID=59734 RepID=UPI001C559DB6|nr:MULTISPECIES: glycosyltransferase family 4 protein [Empedobacter]MBW1618954.1 glycosyltransferase family 4 protein [Empedobacter falsenii]MDM1297960.1 glycosyltransferase family 4 protein [Empedobacter falsenii]MDM1317965.1 glycosyltransferase family 4 protein [Empedobacter falsenii]
MRILNVTSIEDWRGGDAQMYTIYNLLKKYDEIEQFILCPDTSILSQKCEADKASYFTYNKKSKIKSLIKPIQQIVKNQNIDVLHVHDSSALSASILAKILSCRDVRIIYSRKRNNRIKNNFFSKLKYDNKYVEEIVCVSKAVEQIYHDVNVSPNKLVTIYDAIDVQKFSNQISKNIIHKELNLSNETKIVGNICSLTKQKDVKTFIDSAKVIIENYNEEIAFVIIGDGVLKDDLKEYSELKGLNDKVYFLGFRDNVDELLPELDVLLITSLTEGLPLSIYEAFASRVPIVSTKAGGISEVVKNNETGFVSEIKDVDDLAKKVILILLNDELRNNIIENAYQLVSTKFDLKNLEENYLNYYKTLNQ